MMTLGTIYLIIYYTHEDSFHIMTISSPIVRCPLLLPLGQGRALKKSPFFMTKTENAYDL